MRTCIPGATTTTNIQPRLSQSQPLQPLLQLQQLQLLCTACSLCVVVWYRRLAFSTTVYHEGKHFQRLYAIALTVAENPHTAGERVTVYNAYGDVMHVVTDIPAPQGITGERFIGIVSSAPMGAVEYAPTLEDHDQAGITQVLLACMLDCLLVCLFACLFSCLASLPVCLLACAHVFLLVCGTCAVMEADT